MEAVINNEILLFFQTDQTSISRLDYLAEEVNQWELNLENQILTNAAGEWLNRQFLQLSTEPYDAELLEVINQTLLRLHDMNLKPDLFHAQNVCFRFGKEYLETTAVEGWSEEQLVRWKVKFKAVAAQIKIHF